MRVVVLIAAVLLGACGVPHEQYQAKALEADQLLKKYQDVSDRATALEKKVAELDEARRQEEERTRRLAQAKEELEKRSAEYEKLAQSLKGEISAGKIELSELKGKMTLKMKDKILFASGSARLGKEGKDALGRVAEALKSAGGRIIRVEGHTDDEPVNRKSAFKTNWELSVARALAVVNQLQEDGVDPAKLSAAGFGQYHPVAANDSAENRSLNRRIEIVLAAAPPEEPASATPAAQAPASRGAPAVSPDGSPATVGSSSPPSSP